VNDLRKGSQRPTLLREPPDAVDWRLSDIAVEWTREVAGILLDEWQEWLLRWTFARRADGLWAARDVGAEVPRQNGKNVWLEAVELVSVFEFRDRLITHSAHRADVSQEHFISLKEHIEASDALMEMMPRGKTNDGFMSSNGKESITLGNGARIQFKARAKSSGRGPRPSKIVFDEMLILSPSQVGSMAPGTTAQRNPQLIFASSPPYSTSEVQHSLRRRAERPKPDDRLFYAAWNNPEGTDVDDRDAWYRVNPSLGYGRMTETSLQANRHLMSEAEYQREHMGIPERPLDDADAVIDLTRWALLADPESAVARDRCWALEVSDDRRFAAFGEAGRRADGLLHVALVEAGEGVDWVVAMGAELYGINRLPLRIQKGSPAASFVKPLQEAGVKVEELTVQDHADSAGFLRDSTTGPNPQLRHRGQPVLTESLRTAELRAVGDVEVWRRRTAGGNTAPIVAVTLALGGVPKESKRAPRIHVFAKEVT
jgi:hypothetical protein